MITLDIYDKNLVPTNYLNFGDYKIYLFIIWYIYIFISLIILKRRYWYSIIEDTCQIFQEKKENINRKIYYYFLIQIDILILYFIKVFENKYDYSYQILISSHAVLISIFVPLIWIKNDRKVKTNGFLLVKNIIFGIILNLFVNFKYIFIPQQLNFFNIFFIAIFIIYLIIDNKNKEILLKLYILFGVINEDESFNADIIELKEKKFWSIQELISSECLKDDNPKLLKTLQIEECFIKINSDADEEKDKYKNLKINYDKIVDYKIKLNRASYKILFGIREFNIKLKEIRMKNQILNEANEFDIAQEDDDVKSVLNSQYSRKNSSLNNFKLKKRKKFYQNNKKSLSKLNKEVSIKDVSVDDNKILEKSKLESKKSISQKFSINSNFRTMEFKGEDLKFPEEIWHKIIYIIFFIPILFYYMFIPNFKQSPNLGKIFLGHIIILGIIFGEVYAIDYIGNIFITSFGLKSNFLAIIIGFLNISFFFYSLNFGSIDDFYLIITTQETYIYNIMLSSIPVSIYFWAFSQDAFNFVNTSYIFFSSILYLGFYLLLFLMLIPFRFYFNEKLSLIFILFLIVQIIILLLFN